MSLVYGLQQILPIVQRYAELNHNLKSEGMELTLFSLFFNLTVLTMEESQSCIKKKTIYSHNSQPKTNWWKVHLCFKFKSKHQTCVLVKSHISKIIISDTWPALEHQNSDPTKSSWSVISQTQLFKAIISSNYMLSMIHNLID